MSNVLIAIVGLILFVGLAIAGTMYLGDAWEQTRRESEAVQVLEQMNQVMSAVSLFQTERRVELFGGSDIRSILVANGYLKIYPISPIMSDDYIFQSSENVDSNSVIGDVVIAPLGDNLFACQVINARGRISNDRNDSLPEVSSATDIRAGLTQQTGCFRVLQAIPAISSSAGDYVAYTRI